MSDQPFEADFLRRLERLRLRVRAVLASGASGERKSRQLGHGMEFADRRPYCAGDDIRRLDWNVLARLDEPVVRLYQRDASTPVHVILDASSSMRTGTPSKFACARQLAAAIAYVSLCEMDTVSISYLNDGACSMSRPMRGRASMILLMNRLENAQPGGATNLLLSTKNFLSQARRGGRTFVISDFYDLAGAQQSIAQLRQHRHEVTAIQLLAKEDYAPADSDDSSHCELRDLENEDKRTSSILLHRELYTAFASAHEAFCTQLAETCRHKQAGYVRLDCADSLETSFVAMARPEGVWG